MDQTIRKSLRSNAAVLKYSLVELLENVYNP
jgi:hypothetical protein